MKISVVRGDITGQQVDVIVNAANSSLLGGGGVDGAIHRVGGPAILAECRALRAARFAEGLRTGQAAATTAGKLHARWVIHTVGPVYVDVPVGPGSLNEESWSRAEQLASAYRESLRVADELGATSIAFPAISTGAYGWPLEDAAKIAITAVVSVDTRVEEARFVLFSGELLEIFERVLVNAGPTNAQLLATVASQPKEKWRALFDAMDRLVPADLVVANLPYPDYSPTVRQIDGCLVELGMVFPFDWPTWRRITPLDPAGAALASRPVSDAIRLATCLIRGERFGDGTIAEALESGTFQALLSRVRRWYERGQ